MSLCIESYIGNRFLTLPGTLQKVNAY